MGLLYCFLKFSLFNASFSPFRTLIYRSFDNTAAKTAVLYYYCAKTMEDGL